MSDLKKFENKIFLGDCIDNLKKIPDNSIDLRPTLFFDPNSFLLVEQRFFIRALNRTMTIKYNYYQKVEGENIPKGIEFLIPYDDGVRRLVLEYTKVDFPEELNLPYNIPEGYKLIKFR